MRIIPRIDLVISPELVYAVAQKAVFKFYTLGTYVVYHITKKQKHSDSSLYSLTAVEWSGRRMLFGIRNIV